MTRHIAVYVRGSSRARDCAGQEDALRRWCGEQTFPVRWYRDRQEGPARDRPGWNRLMKAVHAGAVATAAVWRLDRIGRTAKGLAALVRDLSRRQVRLVSLEDGLDLATASGRRLARFLAAVAQYDHQARAARVRDGQAEARARGATFGRPVGTGTPIKVTPQQEARVRRLKAEGETITAIARRCELSRPTVYSILGRECAGPAD